jgi:hypothetical protein
MPDRSREPNQTPVSPVPPVRRVLCRGACRDARLVSWCVSGRRFGMLRGLDFGRALCTPRRERDVSGWDAGYVMPSCVIIKRALESCLERFITARRARAARCRRVRRVPLPGPARRGPGCARIRSGSTRGTSKSRRDPARASTVEVATGRYGGRRRQIDAHSTGSR